MNFVENYSNSGIQPRTFLYLSHSTFTETCPSTSALYRPVFPDGGGVLLGDVRRR